ncbi:hypothetical protein PDM28_11430 [Stenotrophomonas aracearum]|uniref:Ribbon-helix-helix protein CopG domain-containing protein n=1 Tax=Stenotrophomonas aracearum TaxID=3003272 RepID=A0ABY9Y8Y2_9GAMM|nr:hypothetical protein [Stenotrophomonas sp. A5588]WNH47312.1 hypothetical protein PDM28_11430 [Stenotrophomonas sp. A5588]
MKLIKRNVLLESDQLRSLNEMAIRKRTSVNELMRMAVDGLLNDQLFNELHEKTMQELRSFADREERRLTDVRRELLSDLSAGIQAMTEASERHIERSTDLTKAFVRSLSDALNGEPIQEKAMPAVQGRRSSREILNEMQGQGATKTNNNPN